MMKQIAGAVDAQAEAATEDSTKRSYFLLDLFRELMVRDALERSESCGGHFRLESQTEEGEALRDDENFAHVSAWEYKGAGETPVMHKEPLDFEYVKLTQRSYK